MTQSDAVHRVTQSGTVTEGDAVHTVTQSEQKSICVSSRHETVDTQQQNKPFGLVLGKRDSDTQTETRSRHLANFPGARSPGSARAQFDMQRR